MNAHQVEGAGSAALKHSRGQFEARISANVPLCREHFRLVLSLDKFPSTRPGQFIQISCRDLAEDYNPECEFDWPAEEGLAKHGRELFSPLAFLRRPFSLAGRRDTERGVDLEIIQRVVGVGTDWMSRLKMGDSLQILGPLGNCFTLPREDGVAVLVGGGVGIPPMLYLAEALAGRKATAFCGALTRELLPLSIVETASGADFGPALNIAEFARHGVASVITTDDGSFGYRGLVTQALEQYLDRELARMANRTIIYTCGPEPMMKRVAQIAADRGMECQIAVERAMACGMGTCQSCCIRVRKADASKPPLEGKDWCYRLACTDGPVFKGADLLW